MSEIRHCSKHDDGYFRWSVGDECPMCQLKAQLTAAQEALRWIPVAERLPINTDQVWICYAQNAYTYNAYYDPAYKTWNIFDYSGGYKRAEDNPTHWRPITLPDEKKEAE